MRCVRWFVPAMCALLFAAPHVAHADIIVESVPVAGGTMIDSFTWIIKGDVLSDIAATINPFGASGTMTTSLDGDGNTDLVFSPSSPVVVPLGGSDYELGVDDDVPTTTFDSFFTIGGGSIPVAVPSVSDDATGASEDILISADVGWIAVVGLSGGGNGTDVTLFQVPFNPTYPDVTITNEDGSVTEFTLSNLTLGGVAKVPVPITHPYFPDLGGHEELTPFPPFDVRLGLGESVSDPVLPEPSGLALWGLSCAAFGLVQRTHGRRRPIPGSLANNWLVTCSRTASKG